jgi:hypothetical protein
MSTIIAEVGLRVGNESNVTLGEQESSEESSDEEIK